VTAAGAERPEVGGPRKTAEAAGGARGRMGAGLDDGRDLPEELRVRAAVEQHLWTQRGSASGAARRSGRGCRRGGAVAGAAGRGAAGAERRALQALSGTQQDGVAAGRCSEAGRGPHVQLVREEGTRRVQLVREGGGGVRTSSSASADRHAAYSLAAKRWSILARSASSAARSQRSASAAPATSTACEGAGAWAVWFRGEGGRRGFGWLEVCFRGEVGGPFPGWERTCTTPASTSETSSRTSASPLAASSACGGGGVLEALNAACPISTG
jgi:hypothetical protein